MKIRINYKEIIGYISIYFLLIANQSQLYSVFLYKYSFIIVVVFGVLIILKKGIRYDYSLVFILLLLLIVSFVRYTIGGVGINAWINWSVPILVTTYAIIYNKFTFAKRFINIVTFMAAFSLFGYLLGVFAPNIWHAISISYNTNSEVRTYTGETVYTFSWVRAHGLFFFSLPDNRVSQNHGIFTEPGIFQMVLNSALFFIVVLNNSLNFTNKKRIRNIVIILLALLTNQSTTGYIGLCYIILYYFISRNVFGGLKSKVFMGLVCGIIILVIVF